MAPSLIRYLIALILIVAFNHAHASSCQFATFSVTSEFEGGAFSACELNENGALELTIVPENKPINDSPWYAFEITSARAVDLTVVLKYHDGRHRYSPKVSSDGEHWVAIEEEAVYVSKARDQAEFSVDLSSSEPTIVAAQPLIGRSHMSRWLTALTATEKAKVTSVGRSVQGRDVLSVKSHSKQKEILVVLGRQHPPETTGAIALMAFMDRIFLGDALSTAFLTRVGVLMYPFINPDGVTLGHWRQNVGGLDLNRDWGPFTQPETRAVSDDIKKYVESHHLQVGYMLDFHSTWHDVFYTQRDSDYVARKGFTATWLSRFQDAAKRVVPQYEINRKSSHNAEKPTSKSYFFEIYGIPATTYEIGDDRPVDEIKRLSVLSAEAFMTTWLEEANWYE
jgi:hypothetical protein